MSINKSLRKVRRDEFYTQLSDIEHELKNYHEHFRNKIVLCNCDDPHTSNFFKYFSLNFKKLKLKKLITTCYKNQQMELFSNCKPDKAIKLEYKGEKNDNKVPDIDEIGIIKFDQDGDFRSQECIDILKQVDIVCTNPPFSLFREYVEQLVKYKKKFLIIGTWNVISYKEIFPLIKNNKIWMGINNNRNFSGFSVPKHYSLYGTEAYIDEDGNRIISSNNTCWFTNIDYEKQHKDLILYKKYNKTEYPKYDNYNAINVDKTKEIPMDYDGEIGVPITFMDKFNPEQFKIIGTGRQIMKKLTGKCIDLSLNGKEKYTRIIIKKKT